jgi:hypothetical protein
VQRVNRKERWKGYGSLGREECERVKRNKRSGMKENEGGKKGRR